MNGLFGLIYTIGSFCWLADGLLTHHWWSFALGLLLAGASLWETNKL